MLDRFTGIDGDNAQIILISLKWFSGQAENSNYFR